MGGTRREARTGHAVAERFGALRGTTIGPVESFDGTRLNAEEIGAGPTVVLAHGFCLTSASWHFQIRDLPGDFRLVLYDQRGHGRSGMPASGDWSMEALAHDLDAIVGAAGERAVLCGHSMGGMAIMRWCSMFPERLGRDVAALVLVDTSAADVIGGMLPGAARAALPAIRLLEEAAVRAAARSPEGFDRVRKARADLVALMVRLMGFGPRAPAAELAFVAEMLGATAPDVLVAVFQTLRKMDVSAALDEIDVPVMVVAGSRDKITPPAAGRRIAQAIHSAELVTIRGAGHMPMLERPDVFNDRLRSFIANPGAALGGRRIG